MKLYGTTTSPYTRAVRVVAAEVGVAVEMIDTATDAGQVQLREVSPIRKVPVAVVDARTVFDSRVIIEWLTTTRGFGALSPPRDRWRQLNLLNAIDGALDSMIQLYYLKRDGVPVDGSAFATRQLDRVEAIFAWLATQLVADRRAFGDGFGLPELALVCALDWLEFRAVLPMERASSLASVRTAWSERPSLATTRPHT